MAIEKILGIETEYGIAGGPELDPILASSIIVNAYAQEGRTRTNWDFDAESPDVDARGSIDLTAFAPIVETHLANTVLTNGARLYVDHAHPEYSSPECRTPLEATLYDLAGEEVMRRAMVIANDSLDEEDHITLYKNNSDGKGNSYGTHENYLLSRDVDFKDVIRAMVPHFISRQILVGAGKVGAETEEGLLLNPSFQLSPRAEFFEEVVGLETTLKRPIVNTRDEPHADAERFRRLHVISGDANMSHVATFLKLGSTSILLALLEDCGAEVFPPMPAAPVRAFRGISRDTTLTCTVDTVANTSLTAWDYQDQLWHVAQRYVDKTGATAVAGAQEVALLMAHWRELLDNVRDNREATRSRIDWVAKQRVVEGMKERYGLVSGHPKLQAIDLQWHDIRPEKSLSSRAGLETLFELGQIREAVHNPPTSTRAYFRGQCVARYPDQLIAANWDSLVFDVGSGPLQRIPMMDPMRGTEQLTGDLFKSSPTIDDLLERINR